jgi:hypothetical protein
MKVNLRTIGLVAFIGAATIGGSSPDARATNAVSKELEKGGTEPEYFQVPRMMVRTDILPVPSDREDFMAVASNMSHTLLTQGIAKLCR